MKPDSAWTSTANASLVRAFRMVRRQVRRFQRRADPRATHDLRVSIRRARAVLQFFTDAWPEADCDRMHRRLKAVAQSLGPLRDWEASSDLLKAARPRMKNPDLRHAAARTLAYARDQMAQALASHQAALSRKMDALSREMRPVLAKRLRRPGVRADDRKAVLRLADRRIHDGARPVERQRPGRSGTAHDWHIYRIRVKKYRYAAELARQCGCPGLHPLIRRLRAIQKTLGEFHDATVLIARLRRSRREGLAMDERHQLEDWLVGHQQKWLRSARKKARRL